MWRASPPWEPWRKNGENEIADLTEKDLSNGQTHRIFLTEYEMSLYKQLSNTANDVNFYKIIAPADFQMAFWAGVRNTVEKLGLRENFRTVANTGRGAGQSVMHFHIHIMSDERFVEEF